MLWLIGLVLLVAALYIFSAVNLGAGYGRLF
jgi:hypothetical protein